MKKQLFTLLLVINMGSFAAEMVERPWEATAEVGIIATAGNTETTTVQAKADIKQQLQRWHNQYIFSVLFKEDQVLQDDDTKQTEKTAERYFGSVKGAYQLERDNTNFFLYGSYSDDQFGAYRTYSTFALGFGARLLETPNMKLDAEIGPGYFRANRVLQDETTETESGTLVRAAAAYAWQITETAEFKQTLSIESAEENTRTVAESSLSTRINGAMQMKVGVNIANDSDVAPDKKPTDIMSYVNLVYKF